METSAQLLHTCVLSSQSHRHPSTYLPGLSAKGIRMTSRMARKCVEPEQPSQGGGKEVLLLCQLLSHREQSEPGVPGHGLHGPLTSSFSHGSHAFGVALVSLGPAMQRGPSLSVGNGSRATI